MKYLRNMQHIYAERLFGMAIGLFVGAILMNNQHTSYGTIMAVYTLVALAIIGSLVLGVWAYIESYGQKKSEREVPREP